MHSSIVKPLIAGFLAIVVLIGYQSYLNMRSAGSFSGANRAERKLATVLGQVDPGKDLRTDLPHRPSSAGIPISISIPGIDIHADIVEVGLTTNDEMASPKQPEEAGWYRYGPRPGDPGLSIIVGHSGWINKRPVAFDALKLVAIGDRLSVTDDRGMEHEFIVRSIDRFPSHATLEEIQPQKISSDLALITCAGDWDREKQRYGERLVVAARYIGAVPASR